MLVGLLVAISGSHGVLEVLIAVPLGGEVVRAQIGRLPWLVQDWVAPLSGWGWSIHPIHVQVVCTTWAVLLNEDHFLARAKHVVFLFLTLKRRKVGFGSLRSGSILVALFGYLADAGVEKGMAFSQAALAYRCWIVARLLLQSIALVERTCYIGYRPRVWRVRHERGRWKLWLFPQLMIPGWLVLPTQELGWVDPCVFTARLLLRHSCWCFEFRWLQQRFAKAFHWLEPIFTFFAVHDSAFVI